MYTTGYAPFGYDGIIVRVEADLRRGIPGIDISGLAAGAVREARERVRAAFRNSGYQFPLDRILINLAPAGVKKDGASLDLAIALAVMAAAGFIPEPQDIMVIGELELSGRLRPVRGVLAAMAAGLTAGIREFIVPAANAAEAAILRRKDSANGEARIAGLTAVSSLDEAVQALFVRRDTGALPAPAVFASDEDSQDDTNRVYTSPSDFAWVKGQKRYKRAMEIAAAGGHNLLVFGPPGAGKTMLARALPSIMPPLLLEEAVEATRLHSLAGCLLGDAAEASGGVLIERPPFREPHHTASPEGILGGGKFVRPGEISLAHNGVLFLDEAPQFRMNVLQALREPLESRVVTISRAEGQVRLPADFQLVLSANPCPCGRLGRRAPPPSSEDDCGDNNHKENLLPALTSDSGDCFCSADQIRRYWRKLGGALLDRIEIRVPVNTPRTLAAEPDAEVPSAAVAERVKRAVNVQRQRFAGTRLRRNAGLDAESIERCCALGAEAERALGLAVEKLGLSGRAYHSILRVARTIADLEGEDAIQSAHILEAVQHRRWGDDPFDVFQAQ